jgi:F-type H+-transporting ATPase subunit delta
VTAQEDKTTGMPGRYATALFELAQEAKAVDQVSADLDSFAAMLDGSEDMVRLVRSPVFGAADQVAALDAIKVAMKEVG